MTPQRAARSGSGNSSVASGCTWPVARHVPKLTPSPDVAVSLEVNGLSHAYGDLPVLQDLDFRLRSGSLTALVGPNGAGKSTLLHLLQGGQPPQLGSMTLGGEQLECCRRRVALMPQRSEIDWHFPITVKGFVGLGRMRGKRSGCCDVEGALQRVGIGALAGRRLDRLSGGQQQRALLARTLVQPAELLLLDEPCAAIDPPTRTQLLRLMRQLADAGMTLLVSSHDWGPDLDGYDHVLVLDGRLLAQGSPQAVRHTLGDMHLGNHRCG